jgi:carbon-monoxide dehydrogenase medium subunit
MWETYYTPTSIDDALRILAEHGPDARIIAGGTDLLVELQRGSREARALIDVTRIGGLNSVTLDGDGLVHIGPGVTHNRVVASDLLVERAYPLALACWHVGTPQLRNRGTIAGNLVTASPANDTIAVLQALGAHLTLRSTDGQRRVPLGDFYLGLRETALAPHEMVTDIAFPALGPNQRGVFAKMALRRVHAISVVNAAVVLTFEGNAASGAIVHDARISMGSVAPTVVRARGAENALAGRALSETVIARAAELAAEDTSCIDDIRAGAGYRHGVISVLVRRALTSLREGSERDALPETVPLLWGNATGASPRLAGKTVRHHRHGLEPIECTVNGENAVVQGANDQTLLQMLREHLGLTGTKQGCAEGECGACTVWMDGISVLACLTPAPRAHGTQIVTVEGLADGEELHPVQQAFIDEGAIQCGYCTPGFVMAGASLLDEIPRPTRQQIEAGLSGNLCRCTGYYKIVRAIEEAAESMNP